MALMKPIAVAASSAVLILNFPALSSAADVLIVGPGKVAGLRMGESTQKARQGGWIRRDPTCGTWTTGSKTYRSNAKGEIFKAYPENVRGGRVLSMWATGEVVTARGVRTRSLSSNRQGSSLRTLKRAYPDLKRLGWWTPGADWDLDEDVYTVGSRSKGWLDFYVDNSTGRVSTVIVRSNDVSWLAFKGADGC